MKSVTDYIHALKERLDAFFHDSHGEAFHTSTDPNDGGNTAIPLVYELCLPSSATVSGGFPEHTPCVVLTWDEYSDEDRTYTVSLHTCVAYAAIANREIVDPVEGTDRYQYRDTDGYDTESSMQLIVSSIRFMERVLDALHSFSDMSIDNIEVEPPTPSLDTFPYSTARIGITIHADAFRIARNAYHDLY